MKSVSSMVHVTGQALMTSIAPVYHPHQLRKKVQPEMVSEMPLSDAKWQIQKDH